MNTFATKPVESIKARQLVEELFINGEGQLAKFEDSLLGTTYEAELRTLLRYIEHFANGNSCGDRMLYLKGVPDGVTEYEFRTKHIRIYVIQQVGKKIIIYLGIKKKADSRDLIAAFRTVKIQYLEFLKSRQ